MTTMTLTTSLIEKKNMSRLNWKLLIPGTQNLLKVNKNWEELFVTWLKTVKNYNVTPSEQYKAYYKIHMLSILHSHQHKFRHHIPPKLKVLLNKVFSDVKHDHDELYQWPWPMNLLTWEQHQIFMIRQIENRDLQKQFYFS